MTLRAVQAGMRPLEGPDGSMVEGRALPGLSSGSVAHLACRGKIQQLVVRILGIVVIIPMTGDTGGWKARILPAGMTIGTLRQLMLTVQNEDGVRELGAFPGLSSDAVTKFTQRREAQSGMVGILGTIVVLFMASQTVRWKTGILPAGMAVRTLR